MAKQPTSGSMHKFVLEVIASFENYQIQCERNLGSTELRARGLILNIETAWENVPASIRRYYIEEYSFRGLYNLEVLLEKRGDNEPPL
jgi:hypothetical protein